MASCCVFSGYLFFYSSFALKHAPVVRDWFGEGVEGTVLARSCNNVVCMMLITAQYGGTSSSLNCSKLKLN
ncbi:hypothetical protein O9929_00545 [Vibrio lentus]|nr:hypothetical protein [Vibrio lentus]